MGNQLKRTFFFKVMKREVQRILNSRVMLFILVVAPIASLVTLTWIFSAGVVNNLPVTIVDQDNTAISRKIVQMINTSAIARVESYKPSLLEAKKEMDKGKTEAIVVLPKNLEKEISKGQSSSVAVYINNTNLIKGGALKSGLYKTLATISTGIKVQSYMKTGLSERQAINQAMPVQLDSHLLFNSFGNYSYFLTIGLLPLMINLLVFMASTYAMGIELKEKTAGDFMKTANNSITVALTGKLIPYTIIFLLHSMLMNFIFFHVIGIPIHGSLGVILVSEILQLIAYQLIAVLFLSVTSNLRLSLSLGSAYTLMSLSFSGLTFPAIGMPQIARIFSWVFPNTFWIEIFVSQTLRAQPLSTIAIPFATFLIFIVGSLAAFPLMSKRFKNSIYWGKI